MKRNKQPKMADQPVIIISADDALSLLSVRADKVDPWIIIDLLVFERGEFGAEIANGLLGCEAVEFMRLIRSATGRLRRRGGL